MSIISDFTSLFEIGVGLGVGLTLFRIPVDNRKRHLIQRVESRIELFKHKQTAEATIRYETFSEISIQLDIEIGKLERAIKHHPIGMLLGAFLNVIFLVVSAFDPELVVSFELGVFFVFIAFGWYSLAASVLLFLISHFLGPIERRVDELEA